MPPPVFDVRSEAWIPVHWLNPGGTTHPTRVGLRELLLRAHEIADIALPEPPAAAGLMRILYTIAARVAHLDECDDTVVQWRRERARVLQHGRFTEEDIDAYFDEYPGAWNLFDAHRPWLQDPRLVEQCEKHTNLNKLDFQRSSGNNQVWLSHDTDLSPRPIPAAEAAWHLIAWLYYGMSGRCTSRTANGRAEANMTSGPLRRSISFHPQGSNLYESVVVGLVPPNPEADLESDLAPWEQETLPDPLGAPPVVTGVVSLLTGRFRHAVLLFPDETGRSVIDCVITWAWRLPQGPAKDPYLLYQPSKTGDLYARYADADRAIWRDLDALLLKRSPATEATRPAVFDALIHLGQDVAERLRVRAYGFDQDGQTRDRQWFTALTPEVLGFLEEHDEANAIHIARAREHAEKVGSDLRTALTRAWVDVTGTKGGDIPWLRGGLFRYWADAEDLFWTMVRTRDFPGDLNSFVLTASRAFEEVTDPYASRPGLAKAIERARSRLFAAWISPAAAELPQPEVAAP